MLGSSSVSEQQRIINGCLDIGLKLLNLGCILKYLNPTPGCGYIIRGRSLVNHECYDSLANSQGLDSTVTQKTVLIY